ncbi:hypothetical protein GIB67_017256 [Kingdonia uniflora]|uniref:Uncharacterized protein n=1 Tax=Kingdonia uniflora TaxID=39325 RepID=A0A7J7LXB5_9MAGN|nr:hypothetical protein GIB67_017256 [Kingdonia uniflora]
MFVPLACCRLVLCELISSKPAVDINRHRYEISLANMAINKVQNHLIHELVDPHLGFDSDYSVRKMVTLVAELAFRYLQQDKDMRPSMVEVLDVLKFIEKQDYNTEQADKMDPVRRIQAVEEYSAAFSRFCVRQLV